MPVWNTSGSFPKGYVGVKQLTNDVVGLLGYHEKRILLSERGACPVHMQTIKTSFDPLLKKFTYENAIDKL